MTLPGPSFIAITLQWPGLKWIKAYVVVGLVGIIGSQTLRISKDDETGMTPRWRVTALASTLELAAHSLAAIGAGVPALPERSDQAPLAIASLMYATPDLGGLLARLEQDRRQLGSLARSLEARLQETHHTAFQFGTLRQLLTEVAIAEPARCAQSLEAHLAALELGELAAAAGEDSELAEDSV